MLIVDYANRVTPFGEDPAVTRQIAMCKAEADCKGMTITWTDVIYWPTNSSDPCVLDQVLHLISGSQVDAIMTIDVSSLFSGKLRQEVACQEALQLGISIISLAGGGGYYPGK